MRAAVNMDAQYYNGKMETLLKLTMEEQQAKVKAY